MFDEKIKDTKRDKSSYEWQTNNHPVREIQNLQINYKRDDKRQQEDD